MITNVVIQGNNPAGPSFIIPAIVTAPGGTTLPVCGSLPTSSGVQIIVNAPGAGISHYITGLKYSHTGPGQVAPLTVTLTSGAITVLTLHFEPYLSGQTFEFSTGMSPLRLPPNGSFIMTSTIAAASAGFIQCFGWTGI